MLPKITNRKLVYKNKRLKVFSQRVNYKKTVQKKFFTISTYDYLWVIAKYKKKFILVKQYRNGPKKNTFEFPSGIVDKKKNLIKLATEEINEETGFSVKKIKFVCKVDVDVGRLENKAYIFFADCEKSKLFEKEENIDIKFVSESELKKMIKENKIISNHIGAFYLAKIKNVI